MFAMPTRESQNQSAELELSRMTILLSRFAGFTIAANMMLAMSGCSGRAVVLILY